MHLPGYFFKGVLSHSWVYAGIDKQGEIAQGAAGIKAAHIYGHRNFDGFVPAPALRAFNSVYGPDIDGYQIFGKRTFIFFARESRDSRGICAVMIFKQSSGRGSPPL